MCVATYLFQKCAHLQGCIVMNSNQDGITSELSRKIMKQFYELKQLACANSGREFGMF